MIYMEAVTRYLLSHLPISDDFLREVEWVDPSMDHINLDAVINFTVL